MPSAPEDQRQDVLRRWMKETNINAFDLRRWYDVRCVSRCFPELTVITTKNYMLHTRTDCFSIPGHFVMDMWSSGVIIGWPLSSTSRCDVKLHHTWSTTASWSRTPDTPSFGPLTPTSSLFREQTLDLATGVSWSQVREFGTVYPPYCSSLTLNLDTLNEFWRHFCLVRSRRISDTMISLRMYKLIYLLTYC